MESNPGEIRKPIKDALLLQLLQWQLCFHLQKKMHKTHDPKLSHSRAEGAGVFRYQHPRVIGWMPHLENKHPQVQRCRPWQLEVVCNAWLSKGCGWKHSICSRLQSLRSAHHSTLLSCLGAWIIIVSWAHLPYLHPPRFSKGRKTLLWFQWAASRGHLVCSQLRRELLNETPVNGARRIHFLEFVWELTTCSILGTVSDGQ